LIAQIQRAVVVLVIVEVPVGGGTMLDEAINWIYENNPNTTITPSKTLITAYLLRIEPVNPTNPTRTMTRLSRLIKRNGAAYTT
jgi:hypothetical protein